MYAGGGSGERASDDQLRLMMTWLDLVVPTKLELIVGSGMPSNVSVEVAEFELCVPVNLLLNPPETKVCVPVELNDCRGICF